MNNKVTTILFSIILSVSQQTFTLKTVEELYNNPKIDEQFSKDACLLGMDPEEAKSYSKQMLITNIEDNYNSLNEKYKNEETIKYEEKIEAAIKKIFIDSMNKEISEKDLQEFSTETESLLNYLINKYEKTIAIQFFSAIIARVSTLSMIEISLEYSLSNDNKKLMAQNLSLYNEAITTIILNLIK